MSRLASTLEDYEPQFKVRPKSKQRYKGFLKRSPLRRKGRKVLEWEAIRRILKRKFVAAGIIKCELKLSGCWIDNGLGFCHTRKRRNCSPTDLWICCLGCNACHNQIELLPESEMEQVVLAVIAKRDVPVCWIAKTLS